MSREQRSRPAATREPKAAYSYSSISAGGNARQHNGNVINLSSNHYSIRQRRSDETLREDERSPPLLEAAAEGQTARVNYLLRLGVNLDHRDEDGLTALHHAALSGFEDTVRCLVDAGANVNAGGSQGVTPICLAALKSRSNVVSVLLNHRARTTGRDAGLVISDLCQSGLHCAVMSNDIPTARLFLEHGVEVNGWCKPPSNLEGSIGPHLSADLQKHLSPPRNSHRWPAYQAVHLAVLNENVALIGCLLRAGAKLNDLSPTEEEPTSVTVLTPLMLACLCGLHRIAQYLISNGADPLLADKTRHRFALSSAAANGHTDCINLLLDSGVDIDTQHPFYGTVLMQAILAGQNSTASMLLHRGAAHDRLDQTGRTTLDVASECGLHEIAQELVLRGSTFRKAKNSYRLIRLWNVQNFSCQTFAMFDHDLELPPYATLSQRWREDEQVTYHSLASLSADERQRLLASTEANYHFWSKIKGFFAQCKYLRIQWAWAEHLCISTADEAETQAAIDVAFQIHDRATHHLIYLDDIDSTRPESLDIAKSSFFRCSGALRDLLANDSKSTQFFDCYWNHLGSRDTLSPRICGITRILPAHLEQFSKASVAAKLSWCASLLGAKPEDSVYAILKIVGVTLKPRYGEGGERAFRRLQEIVIDSLNDESIFAWDLQPKYKRSTILLAPAIDYFSRCRDMQIIEGPRRFRLSRDDQGLARGVKFTGIVSSPTRETRRIRLQCFKPGEGRVCLWLRKRDDGQGWKKDSMFFNDFPLHIEGPAHTDDESRKLLNQEELYIPFDAPFNLAGDFGR